MSSVVDNPLLNPRDTSLAPLLEQLPEQQKLIDELQSENQHLRAQLDWFKRQIFGEKSERREHNPDQLALFQAQLGEAPPEPDKVDVPAHKRTKQRSGCEVNDTGLRFDPDVPVKEIALSCPQLDGADADQYEIVGYKESLRLASTPGTTTVLRYRRPVVKHRSTGVLSQAPAPVGPLGHAQADVSFLAGMLVDKFVYHTPLYRQNQKLKDQGVTLSAGTPYGWTQGSISLLTPIAEAVHDIILSGAHIKIDETPIKAGRTKKANNQGRGTIGRMKTGWLWPILGEYGDIGFRYSPSRAMNVVGENLDGKFSGVMQTDGYEVYSRYAALHEHITHALCWSHTRRTFLKAEQSDPWAVRTILALIAVLYRIERQLRDSDADNDEILRVRQSRSKRCVDKIFRWINQQRHKPELCKRSSYTVVPLAEHPTQT